MAMRKKGVLFTLGMSLLVMVLFALAILIFHQNDISEQRAAEMLLAERVHNLFSSVESSISKLYYNTSLIDIRSNTTRLILYPFDFSNQANFVTYTSNLESTITTLYPMINVTHGYGTSNFGFYVLKPSGEEITNYTINSSGLNFKTGTATITSNISRIIIYYYSATQNGTAQWTSVAPNGYLNVTIIAEGTGSWRSVSGTLIDPAAASYGRITGLDGEFNVTTNQNTLETLSNSTDLLNVYNSFYYNSTDVRIYIPVFITVDIAGKVRRSSMARIM